jgi:hypothetical protein
MALPFVVNNLLIDAVDLVTLEIVKGTYFIESAASIIIVFLILNKKTCF